MSKPKYHYHYRFAFAPVSKCGTPEYKGKVNVTYEHFNVTAQTYSEAEEALRAHAAKFHFKKSKTKDSNGNHEFIPESIVYHLVSRERVFGLDKELANQAN